MLTSIGIAVEFTAHPVAAFEFATGTRDERLAVAMKRTGLPVAFGALSSFFGFAFLYSSDFDYVVNYFFFVFLMVVVFGVVNGLIFLPAVLGLFGVDKPAEETKFTSVTGAATSSSSQSSASSVEAKSASVA